MVERKGMSIRSSEGLAFQDSTWHQFPLLGESSATDYVIPVFILVGRKNGILATILQGDTKIRHFLNSQFTGKTHLIQGIFLDVPFSRGYLPKYPFCFEDDDDDFHSMGYSSSE